MVLHFYLTRKTKSLQLLNYTYNSKNNYTLIFTKSSNIFFSNQIHIISAYIIELNNRRNEIRVAEFAWKLGYFVCKRIK